MQYHPTVLLIDDDTDDQEIFSHAMEKANSQAHCIFANDGIQALEKIKADENFRPDYIFIDMNMPRMNGQQCLTEIKKIDRFKDIPVYMYSTSADPESLEENKRLGAKDFIVKPSDVQALVTILRNIVQKPVLAVLFVLASMSISPSALSAQDTIPEITELKKLSVEELMDIVVTSVSKRRENLSEAASAIQVITGYDIRRSAATRLPEALRLAPNLQVLQSGSHDWAITARGFSGAPVANSSLANKLLVMIDGRSVYTPLFGGVFWDVQNVLLEDVDRIEVVSGPGGTLWGSNAVNGVVNIMSKTAKETQGFFGSATYGTVLRDHFALRYGGQVDSSLFFRVYGQRFDSENALLPNGEDAKDSWNRTTGGFRMDFIPTDVQSFTLQGELYAGEEDDTLNTIINGQHLLGRWVKSFSDGSGISVQAYLDRTWRDIRNNPFQDELTTLDFEFDHSFDLGSANSILWGAGYRNQYDKTNSDNNRFTPDDRTLTLWSGFIQDQIEIVPEKVHLTLGSKFLHNEYTGFEVQPSVRIAFTPDDPHTIWAAVSRAVRTPSRFDVELTSVTLVEHPEFISEKVIAYEVGYRMRPIEKISFSLAAFYNQYTDLRTFNFTDNILYFGNDMDANSWGVELSGTILISNWWRVRGGFSYLEKDFTIKASNVFEGNEILEANDPKSLCLVQSIMDISDAFQLDLVARAVDKLVGLPAANLPEVPSYVDLSARLAYEYKSITFSIAGQNLLHESKTEFGNRRIPRGAYANIKIRL